MRLLRLLGRRGGVVGLIVGSLHGCAWGRERGERISTTEERRPGLTKKGKLSETTEIFKGFLRVQKRGRENERRKESEE